MTSGSPNIKQPLSLKMSPASQQRGMNFESHMGAVRPPASAFGHSPAAMPSSSPHLYHREDALGLMFANPSVDSQQMLQELGRKHKQPNRAQYPVSESSANSLAATPRHAAAQRDVSPHLQTLSAHTPASQGHRNGQEPTFPSNNQSAQAQYNVGGGQMQPRSFSSLPSSSNGDHPGDYPTLQDNPLVANIDQDIEDVAHEVRKMSAPPSTAQHSLEHDQHSPHRQLVRGEPGFEIPLDPNLVCSKCNRMFRHGEIQKLRKHFGKCTGKR